jgi:hypothetical protein
MELYETLESSLAEINAAYKERIQDGSLSFSEALTLTYNATATFVRLVSGLPQDNATKKEVVLLALGKFYDVVIKPISITKMPSPIENLVDAALRALILNLASSWVDATINIFDKMGWAPESDDESVAKMTSTMIF